MPRQIVVKFDFREGYATDFPATAGGSYLRQGSFNAMTTGSGMVRPFRGLVKLTDGRRGSRLNFLTDDGFAGLDNNDTVNAKGSVMQTIGLLFLMGQGDLQVNGTPVVISADQVEATTDLSYLTQVSGVFGNASALWQVGHPRPSAPQIFAKSPPSALLADRIMNGTVTVVVWRADAETGQTSLPSPASAILAVANGSVIVQFEAADVNNQTVWGIGVVKLGLADLGNFYQLPTELNGEVLESTLAYTREVKGASILDTTSVVDVTDPTVANHFTSADVGRRIAFGTFDSWITSVVTPTQVNVFDANTTGSTISGDSTVTHAIEGILRSVEIAWTDAHLFGQELAPYQSFSPMDGYFFGNLFDTFYIEDTQGTVFYSLPDEFSFPRSRRIFTEDKAVCYIPSGNGYHWRIAKQSISQLYYAVGERPIQLNQKTKNLGCNFPQNACLGFDGRLLVWTGRPTIITMDGAFNSTFHNLVSKQFRNWENQTAEMPIVPAYDPIGQYELWCYNTIAMAYHAPSGRWCSPVRLSDWFGEGEYIVSQVIIDGRLYLVSSAESDNLYAWDAGTGSDFVVNSYSRSTPEELTTITEVKSIVVGGDVPTRLTYKLVKNFVDELEIGEYDTSTNEFQLTPNWRPNLRGIETAGVLIESNNADGYCAIEFVELWGEWNSVSGT